MASQDWLDKDFYAILGVSSDADAATIKKTYRKLARQAAPGPERRGHGGGGEVQGDRRGVLRPLRPRAAPAVRPAARHDARRRPVHRRGRRIGRRLRGPLLRHVRRRWHPHPLLDEQQLGERPRHAGPARQPLRAGRRLLPGWVDLRRVRHVRRPPRTTQGSRCAGPDEPVVPRRRGRSDRDSSRRPTASASPRGSLPAYATGRRSGCAARVLAVTPVPSRAT